MKLIIGIGNPGKDYELTRHNVGFVAIDKLQESKLSKDLILKKSDRFMNESGVSVKKFLSSHPNIPISNLYVIHDDLDILLGSYKIQFGRGPKDHNGLKSIDNEIGTTEYWHVRVGVDNRPADNRPLGEEYVLQNFTDEERQLLDKTLKEVCKALANF